MVPPPHYVGIKKNSKNVPLPLYNKNSDYCRDIKMWGGGY